MGGLHVGQAGCGIECASSDLIFQFCDVAPEIVSTWSELLGSKLIEIAEVHNRHGLLLMDEAGRCFGASLMHDAFYFEGQNFDEALTRLLLGRRSRPMLKPDQQQVDLYGETFVRGPATWGSGQRQVNCSWATWAPFNGRHGLLFKEKTS